MLKKALRLIFDAFLLVAFYQAARGYIMLFQEIRSTIRRRKK